MKKAPDQVTARSAGFTLLELMITVAVLAIGVGIGIPSFQDMMRRNRLATQTNTFVGAFALARSEAVKRGVRVTLCPASDAVNQNACSNSDDWAENGMIIFTDGRGTIGQVDVDDDDERNNDAIIQRLPPAATQKINIDNARVLISYLQDGALELPPGTDAQFILAPEDCRGDTGARLVQVNAAGRANMRPTACPEDAE